MPVEVLWVVEETQHEPVRLLFLHRQDVRVLACPRADELVEEPAEFAESGVVGPVRVPQTAIPSDAMIHSQERHLGLNGELWGRRGNVDLSPGRDD